jgi:hypothetical protein
LRIGPGSTGRVRRTNHATAAFELNEIQWRALKPRLQLLRDEEAAPATCDAPVRDLAQARHLVDASL